MNIACLLAVMVDFALAPGSVENPSAKFPFKPGEEPVAFAWTDEGLAVGNEIVAWSKLKVGEPKDGATFIWKARCSDGEEAIVRGTLKSSAAAFSIPAHGEVRQRRVDGEIKVTPKAEGDVKVRVICQGPRSPVLRQYKQTKAKAGETVSLTVTGDTTTIASMQYVLTDVDGTVIFRPVNWCIRAADFKFALRTLNGDGDRQILSVFSDNWFDREKPHTLRVEMTDYDSGKLVWAKSVPALTWRNKGYTNGDGQCKQEVDISDLKPGQYTCTVTLVGPDGADVASDYLFFAKPNGPAIWTDTPYGADDTVPPPWTMPAFTDGAFTCWNRHMKFGGPGLVSSIFSSGRELLAEPITLFLDGRPLSFDCRLVRRGVSFADYEFTARGGAPIRVKMRAEFDGYMSFTLMWRPPMGKLDLKASLPRDLVIGFDDCSSAKEKLLLPPGKTCAFDYNAERKQWWWMGSVTAGLLGGFNDERGCRVKDLDKGYRLEVTDETATVIARLVDTPATDGGERTLGFYFEATPVKPKNLAVELTPPDDIEIWTGHVEKHFEDKWPGRICMDELAPFREQVRKGKRVYYYNATSGVSATFPWWGWFGQDWTIYNSSETYSEEIACKDRKRKDRGAWICACPGEKSFREYKIWSICWYLWHPEYEIRDLYWDLATPFDCNNPAHRWKDEFGRTRTHRPHEQVREIHKRCYRELKKKNPDGTMMGHLTRTRTPSDVFFDALVMGECYDADVIGTLSYYDVLNPSVMRMAYASRSNELTLMIIPQLIRAQQMYTADKLKDYNPKEPRHDRAIRHATAYFKIHGLGITRHNSGGGAWVAPDELMVKEFGRNRRFSAYYSEACPVSVTEPEERFLYALYEGNGKKLMILLNDTDREMTKRVNFKSAGVGTDIFGHGTYDFTTGACDIALPPRESRFIYFK